MLARSDPLLEVPGSAPVSPYRLPPAPALQPPPVESFPAHPATWYLFGRSQALTQPVSKRMLARQLVAFRTADGQAVVMAASCSHMGADLGCGRVEGRQIVCPFHGWRYGPDGTCTSIPGTQEIPAFARQKTYPTVERNGYVFFFNGRTALFPLPFFAGENPEGFTAGRIFRYRSDCTWYVNAAHGYDTQHFDSVHDRRLVAPPQIDCPTPFARRNRYRAEVVGRSNLDRILRLTAGKHVDISITNWGGTFVLITGDFDRVHSRFLIATQPLDDGGTLCEGIVFTPKSRSFPGRLFLDPAILAVRRMFTHGYLKDEASRLIGTRYNRTTMIPGDRDMIDYYHWLATLPQDPPVATRPTA